jgi:hypothetical protein
MVAVFAAFTIIRLALYKDERTHHHANLSVFVDGKKLPFADTTFYEETAACTADEKGPKTRIHLHDNKPDAVHVHSSSATWGALFANLGYTLGSDLLQTDEGVYRSGTDGKTLTFMLNGQKVKNVANEVVMSEDVLLVSYGTESDVEVKDRFDKITRNAAEYNKTVDPATCAGSKPLTWQQKLKDIYGIKRAY